MELTMKIVVLIARLLLGLMFSVFGLNLFFNFLNGPLPPGPPGEFLGLLASTHFVYAIGAVMGISGILFLINRFVALGLTLLGPVLFNILVFHIVMQPKTIGPGIVVTLLWLLVFWQHRRAFAGIFTARLSG
jgi:putative oxidoreductase